MKVARDVFIRMSHSRECNEKTKANAAPNCVALAINSSKCPEPHTDLVGNNLPWFTWWESQDTNDSWGLLETSSWSLLRPQARRLEATGLIQVMLNTPTLGIISDIFFPVTVVCTWICNTNFFLLCFFSKCTSLIYWNPSQRGNLT